MHKSNLLDQARCSNAMIWRKRSEVLKLQCTTKGKKTGSGESVAHFILAIAHKSGVVLCEQYAGRFNGAYFAEFIQEHFEGAFKISTNPRAKLFLQDGDPRQKSAIAMKAVYDIGARMYAILPRSPDINPIQRFFHLLQIGLTKQALERKIRHETFTEFSGRVKDKILNFSASTIDKIINSVDKRMSLIIKGKGKRLKY